MTNTTDQIRPFFIWEGIYQNFQSAMVEAKGPGFCGEVFRKRSLRAATECLAAIKSGNMIPAFHKQRSTLLPLTVAMILGDKERVNILDFGGGLGIGYMTLLESIPDDLERIVYTIVEVPEVCQSGMELHGGEVMYTSDLPTTVKFNLVHAASSFQYIEHWQDLVAKFAALKPDYILLSDVFAGSIKSYVTLQNYYESRIPHWFLNLNKLLDHFDNYGYRLSMKCYATSRRLDADDTLPMANFPEDMRLSQSLHLLLQKKGDGHFR
jgi:putative methyltransferase (TIGR04325 family)